MRLVDQKPPRKVSDRYSILTPLPSSSPGDVQLVPSPARNRSTPWYPHVHPTAAALCKLVTLGGLEDLDGPTGMVTVLFAIINYLSYVNYLPTLLPHKSRMHLKFGIRCAERDPRLQLGEYGLLSARSW
jgi:hypothetical protein